MNAKKKSDSIIKGQALQHQAAGAILKQLYSSTRKHIRLGQRVRGVVVILTNKSIIGNQIASLLETDGLRVEVACSDVEAYRLIAGGGIDALIVDIDDIRVSGLAMLSMCKHCRPPMTTYAICQGGCSKQMYLARRANCAGYFYLKEGGMLQLDSSRGMAAELIHACSTDKPAQQPSDRSICHAE